MKTLWILAILLLMPVFAEAAEPAELVEHSLPEAGVSISLPRDGELSTHADPAWDADPEVVLEWESKRAPITMIQVRIDDLGAAIDRDTFDIFMETLIGNWAGSPDYQVTNYAGVKGPPILTTKSTSQSSGSTTTTTTTSQWVGSPKMIQIGSNEWAMVEVTDNSDAYGQTVYYSVFCMHEGSRIYTLTLFYLRPLDDEVQDFGRPVLQSFKPLRTYEPTGWDAAQPK